MNPTKHEWWVVSTVISEIALLLECRAHTSREAGHACMGLVHHPSRDEWDEAFHAPRHPYRWEGGDERVDINPPPTPQDLIDASEALCKARNRAERRRAQEMYHAALERRRAERRAVMNRLL